MPQKHESTEEHRSFFTKRRRGRNELLEILLGVVFNYDLKCISFYGNCVPAPRDDTGRNEEMEDKWC